MLWLPRASTEPSPLGSVSRLGDGCGLSSAGKRGHTGAHVLGGQLGEASPAEGWQEGEETQQGQGSPCAQPLMQWRGAVPRGWCREGITAPS